MNIEFVEQILFGSRVYSPGEQVTLEDAVARHLIVRGVAIETAPTSPEPEPSEVREALDKSHQKSRKATSRKPS